MSLMRFGQILVVVVLMAAGQLLFRKTAVGSPPLSTWRGLSSLALNPAFLVALVMYGAATLLWVGVLQHVPLSRAYAFNALSFIIVPIASILVFGETVSVRFAIGLGLVVAGLVLIGVKN